MLPFSAEQAQQQICQYPSNNPPAVGRLPVLPEADPVLVYASAAVANLAGQLAQTSPARMFCYNMLAANGWLNQNFDECVKYVCDACVIRVRSGQASSPAQILQDCAAEVLTLYASMLVVSFPELARMLPPEAVQSSANNHRIFLDLLEDSKMLYGQVQAMAYQPPLPGAARFARPGVAPTPVAVQAFAHPSGRATYGAVQAPAAPVAPGVLVAKSRTDRTPATVAKVPTPDAAPQKDPTMLTGDIEQMDRAAHAIPYFGRDLAIPTAPLRRKLEESTELFEENSKLNPEETGVNVNAVILPALYFDELIAQALADWLPETEPGALSVQVRQGWVLTPFATPLNMVEFLRPFRQQGTFAGLAMEITKAIEQVTDKVELRKTLLAVSQLDRFLTGILNTFLGNVLGNVGTNLKSTSFLEDAASMSRYLNEKFNGKFNGAYSEFQKRVMCKLFANTRGSEDHLEDLRDTFDGDTAEFLTQAYTLVFINASAQELGYKVTSNVKFIQASETPLLHRLLTAVFAYDTKRDIPANHVLVLADGTRYFVHQALGQPDTFAIQGV